MKKKKKPSYVALFDEIMADPKLDSLRKAMLYCTIISLSRDKGYCFAKQATLAKKLKCKRCTINLLIKELKKEKFIAAIQTYKPHSKNGKFEDSVLHIYPLKHMDIVFDGWNQSVKQNISFMMKTMDALNLLKKKQKLEKQKKKEEFDQHWKDVDDQMSLVENSCQEYLLKNIEALEEKTTK